MPHMPPASPAGGGSAGRAPPPADTQAAFIPGGAASLKGADDAWGGHQNPDEIDIDDAVSDEGDGGVLVDSAGGHAGNEEEIQLDDE